MSNSHLISKSVFSLIPQPAFAAEHRAVVLLLLSASACTQQQICHCCSQSVGETDRQILDFFV